jgi:hypothetical protein
LSRSLRLRRREKVRGWGPETAYSIVKQNIGCINVCGELGHGTAFKINLPSSEDYTLAKSAEESKKDLKETETAFLVEDEEPMPARDRPRMLGWLTYHYNEPYRLARLIRFPGTDKPESQRWTSRIPRQELKHVLTAAADACLFGRLEIIAD